MVECGDVDIGEFEQVRRLAAGGGAGVEHARTRGQAAAQQQGGGQLRGGVLHRHVALRETGQARHRAGLFQGDAGRRPSHCGQALLGQSHQVALDAAAPGVDSQVHRRMLVVGLQDPV